MSVILLDGKTEESEVWLAGVEGAVVVGKLLESGEASTFGYNAATDTYEDLVAAGIIDPLKVKPKFHWLRRQGSPCLGHTLWQTSFEYLSGWAIRHPCRVEGIAAYTVSGGPQVNWLQHCQDAAVRVHFDCPRQRQAMLYAPCDTPLQPISCNATYPPHDGQRG